MQLHHQAWEDLQAASVSAKEAQAYLKMKRGEMVQRFANVRHEAEGEEEGI